MINNNYKIKILFNHQRNEFIEKSQKLNISDIVRISTKINNLNIFGLKCCIWNGYINNFYLNRKRRSIQRIFYINFKDNLEPNEYIKLSCKNNKCCNVEHMYISTKKKIINPIKKIINPIKKNDNKDLYLKIE
jgi:hypothetical protein